MTANDAVLVTGANGFIGSHLVRRLIADGHLVNVLVREGASTARLQDLNGVVVRTGDVTDLESLIECCSAAQPRAVYHLAGSTAGRRFAGEWNAVDQALQVNLLGTLNLIRAIMLSKTPVETLVRTGGLEEYGTGPPPFQETQREQPRSPYSASQVAATHWCQMLQPHLPFSLLTLRPSLVYGEAQSTEFLIPGLICAFLRKQRFDITSGRQTRDLVYVDDFIEAVCMAANASELGGTVLNICSGRAYQVRKVATWIAEELGVRQLLSVGTMQDRDLEIPELVGCNDAALSLLGWRPKTNLEDGLRRTIAWFVRSVAED